LAAIVNVLTNTIARFLNIVVLLDQGIIVNSSGST